MSFRSVLIGRVHFVRWTKPGLTDIREINREVRAASEKRGEKIIGISIVPRTAEPPDDAARAAMSRNLPELLQYAESLHFIMEGSGFRLSIMRSILSGAILLRGESGKIHVHSSFNQTLRQIEPRLEMPKVEFLRMVADSKILTNPSD